MFSNPERVSDLIDLHIREVLKKSTITIVKDHLLYANLHRYNSEYMVSVNSDRGYRHLLLLLLSEGLEQSSLKEIGDIIFKYTLGVDVPLEEYFFDKKLIVISIQNNLVHIDARTFCVQNGIIGEYQLSVSSQNFTETFVKLRKEFKFS